MADAPVLGALCRLRYPSRSRIDASDVELCASHTLRSPRVGTRTDGDSNLQSPDPECGLLVRVSRSNSPNSIHRSIHVPAEEGVDGLRRLPRCGCDVAVVVGHLPGGVPYDRHPHWIAEASLTQHRRMEVTEVVDPNPGNPAGVTEPVEHVDNRRA